MAWYNPDTKQAEVIFNSEGEAKTPSLVYYGQDETLVGKPVADLLDESEDYEESERSDIATRVVRSIKRNLLAPPVIPIPGREPVSPVEVVAEILKKLKRDAEEGHFQETIDRAAITCPAMFDPLQRQVILDAAAMAGFGTVDLVEEPVAAAMAFARLGHKVGANVLVYDLGGGTFDLAVVARENGTSEEESFRVAMEPDGEALCGGDDFDRAIYDYCDAIAREHLGRSLDYPGNAVNPYFLDKCRRQKEKLTYKTHAVVRDYLEGVMFKAELDRTTFETLIEQRVEDTARKTAAMTQRAESRGHEVDTVVLIGGASQVPLVTRRLREKLALEPRKFANKDYAVALGAAYYASVLEVPVPERYLRALAAAWTDERLSRDEVNQLESMAGEPGLDAAEAAEIQRHILGDTIDAVLERQREEYRREAEEAWAHRDLDRAKTDRLDALAFELAVDPGDAAAIETEVFGDTREAVLLDRYRAAVMMAREQLRTLAEELGLSAQQAARIEGELTGSVPVEPEEDLDEAQRFIDEATELWGQGRLDLALQRAQAACEIAPGYAPAFFTKGQLFRERSEWRLAAAAATRCLEIEPEHQGALRDRSFYRLNMGDHAGARLDADRLVALTPSRDNYAWRAVTDSNMGDYSAAISDIRMALEDSRAREAALLPPAALHAVAGVILHEKLDSPQDALAFFEGALEAMPANPGQEYAERFARSCESFGIWVKDPPVTAVHRCLWEACKAVYGDRLREAAEAFDLHTGRTDHAVVDRSVWAGDPDLGLHYASKLARMNRASEAIEWLREVILLHPDFDIRRAKADRWISACKDATLREFLTPRFSYSYLALLNSFTVKNESAFRTTAVKVTVEVTRSGGEQTGPIELEVDALSAGQSHTWRNVFFETRSVGTTIGGAVSFLGTRNVKVNATVTCAEE